MICTIVLAAGLGTRFGGPGPKQFEPLAGRSIVDRSLDTACAVSDGVVLVVPPGSADGETGRAGLLSVVEGGDTRSASVRAGMQAVPGDARVIVVHDAARPLAPPALFQAVIEAVQGGADAAIPALPVSDTIKRVAGGLVVETLDREELVAVQTPQAFDAAMLRRAHEQASDATDDAALVERIGGRVVVLPGDRRALKITVPDDLAVAEALL